MQMSLSKQSAESAYVQSHELTQKQNNNNNNYIVKMTQTLVQHAYYARCVQRMDCVNQTAPIKMRMRVYIYKYG